MRENLATAPAFLTIGGLLMAAFESADEQLIALTAGQREAARTALAAPR